MKSITAEEFVGEYLAVRIDKVLGSSLFADYTIAFTKYGKGLERLYFKLDEDEIVVYEMCGAKALEELLKHKAIDGEFSSALSCID